MGHVGGEQRIREDDGLFQGERAEGLRRGDASVFSPGGLGYGKRASPSPSKADLSGKPIEISTLLSISSLRGKTYPLHDQHVMSV